jgi:hypothetical protein
LAGGGGAGGGGAGETDGSLIARSDGGRGFASMALVSMLIALIGSTLALEPGVIGAKIGGGV